jgi:hypothetical protein
MTTTGTRSVAVGLALLLALVGTASSALAASADDWAKTYCKTGPNVTDALNDSIDTESALTEALRDEITAPGSADIEGAVDGYDADLKKVAKLAKKTAKGLKKTGAPDIKNGKKVQSAGVKAYETAAREIAAAREALTGIDPADPAAATDPLFDLADALGNASSAINDFSFDSLSPAVEKNTDLAKAIASFC